MLSKITSKSSSAHAMARTVARSVARSMAAVALTMMVAAAPAQAGGGDLLVAPTRIVLDETRSAEVILSNIGDKPATYRISLELKRMSADGNLVDVVAEQGNTAEQAALNMLVFSPRRVVLPPGQPQTVRIGIRPPAGMADGEYRVHMLFRAIPDAKPATQAAPTQGIAVSMTPIYGVSIPIIIRMGKVVSTAVLSKAQMMTDAKGHRALRIDMTRQGAGSVYGEVRVLKAGQAKPVFTARGMAIYPEINNRSMTFPLTPEEATAMAGPVTIQYLQAADVGGGLIAELKTVLK